MPHYESANCIDLAKEFPQIEDITGTVKIKPSFGGKEETLHPFTLAHLPTDFTACESPVCNDGGVSQRDVLRELLTHMVRDRKVDGSFGKTCQGYEKMGGRQTRNCHVVYVSITAHITYKDHMTAQAE